MTIMRAQNDGPSPGGQAVLVQSGETAVRTKPHARTPTLHLFLVAFKNGGQAYRDVDS